MLSPQSLCSSDEERFDRTSSPCSSLDSYEYPSSPYASPSPLWMTNPESDSDDYSPVCSEADPNEFATNNDNETNDTVNMETVCEVEEFEDDDTAMCKV